MNKYVFLFELRRELTYMTPDDKEAAAKYYEEYFAEAGPENERQIIEELGPPSRLAAELRREYEEGRPEPTGRELSAGDGPEPAADNGGVPFGDVKTRSPLGNDPFAEEESEKEEEPEREPHGGSRTDGRRPYGSRPSHSPPYGSYRYGRAPYGSRSAGRDGRQPPPGGAQHEGRNPSAKKRLSAGAIVLIVLGAVFFGPVIFGLAVALISVVFSLCIALLSVGVAVIAAGIAAIIAGFTSLSFIPDALMFFGLGFLALSIGLPLFWLFVRCSAKMIRGAGRAVKALWNKIKRMGGKPGE